ncbi:MAG: TetR/AcrR family transcriptional regulator [Flavobacteriales bacterium]|nr:TetR/AcrR family transcriptional regulator [Flavobacteriales bacterium]
MNKLSLDKGRIHQKMQTRASILNATKGLLKKRKKLSLEDIAAKAKVSRATMYRYFPNIELLIMEASLEISHATPEEICENIQGLDLTNKILSIQDHFNALAIEHEVAFRRYLALATVEAINSKKKIRGARRVKTLRLALAPHKSSFKKNEFDRFIASATVLMGIDAIIVCKDVTRLNNEQSLNSLAWCMKSLLKGLEIG